MKKWLWIGLCTAAVACASVGQDYNVATLEALQPGMTRAQVISMLGNPNTRTTLSDGSEQWMWVHARASAFGAAHSKAVMLKFGPDKRFVEIMSATETQIR